ncbi:HTH_48 domain-containing protein [Trichonephila clavipes]|nr:HTH_48 domain-containing protein [Trichonephila clavipes]
MSDMKETVLVQLSLGQVFTLIDKLQCDPSRSCSRHGLYLLPQEPAALKFSCSFSLFKNDWVHALDPDVSVDQGVPTHIRGQTVNQHYYIEVLKRLREQIGGKWPEIVRDGWLLHQGNALAHMALSVTQFLTNKSITVMGNPPYSPDLVSCDFFSLQLNLVEREPHLTSVEDVRAEMENLLRGLAETSF